MGWLPRERLHEVMREAAVFLFPSLHDQAPGVVAEALACGLPIVCLDLGGSPVVGGAGALTVHTKGGPRSVAARVAQKLEEALALGSDRVLSAAYELSYETKLAQLKSILRQVIVLPGEPGEGVEVVS
jgi:glycosyltransferase involved in cell wall biosynthesis